MTSRKIDPNIPNVPYPTASRGLVLGANGRLQTSTMPDEVVLDSDLTTGLGNKVDKDSVVVAATRIVQSKLLAADVNPAFRILGSGKIEWGQGGATAPDTTLFRASASILQTDGHFKSAQTLYAWAGGGNQVIVGHNGAGNAAGLLFGQSGDTNLYRSGATVLASDGYIIAKAGTNQIRIGDGLSSTVPAIYFGSAFDTILYRSSVSTLKTDGTMTALRFITPEALYVRNPSGTSAIFFGTADDTNLYRSAANMLKTDGNLQAVGTIEANAGTVNDVALGHNGSIVTAGMFFGSAADTNLYRSGLDSLKTDDGFTAASLTSLSTLTTSQYIVAYQQIYSGYGSANQIQLGSDGKIYFGSGGEFLWKPFSNALQTNVGFISNASITVGFDDLAARGLYFGSAQSPSITKPAASVLKMSHSLWVQNDIAFLTDASKLYFGAASDVNLYRATSSIVKSNVALAATYGVYALNETQICMYGPSIAHWKMIAGSTVVTTDSNGDQYIPYGVTYTSVLSVVACCGDYTTGSGDICISVHPTLYTTGFYISARNFTTGVLASTGIRINWFAIVNP